MSQPNILFIMSDDHAYQAISAYGSVLNKTPQIDRIAKEGIRLDRCFCTNSICAPSRATILTGKHNHLNGVRTLNDVIDNTQQMFPKILQEAGYETAMIGKWHLGHGPKHNPTGFDYWSILPEQGLYHDPLFYDMGVEKEYKGYVTDITTDKSIEWLQNRNKEKPFMLMCHHKAPHRPWEPNEKHKDLYEDMEIPFPDTFDDDYATRGSAAKAAKMRIDDLTQTDTKIAPPEGMTKQEERRWKYQRFIKDYLKCVVSIDENVGRLLDYLEQEDVVEDTIVVYTSDQGFYLGEHGWFDKRFMYEESFRMPLLIRYPKEIKPSSESSELIVNTDFAPTFLDYAGVEVPSDIQGISLRPILKGEKVDNWRKSVYYRYWQYPTPHNVFPHYGIRTERYKLIYYYTHGFEISENEVDVPKRPEWEFYDLKEDPSEINNLYNNPKYKENIQYMKQELQRVKEEIHDTE